ncbi:tRNA (32-2'-O)-methyltransferase regulator THADA-like [Amphiura filiformis]|uniref:tRNA (32-2'-O)-methyltransferase regulator THADA-like n=1 Tax=Amphiura filiformis TaxID=82378 RepID=UPI003B20F711
MTTLQSNPIQAVLKQLEVLTGKEKDNSNVTGALPWGLLFKSVQQENIEAVTSMKKFGGLLKKVDLSSADIEHEVRQCIAILTQLFTIIDPKGALCRTLASILQGLSIYMHQQVIDKLKEYLTYQLNLTTMHDTQSLVCNVHKIGACMENFKLGEKCLESCLNPEVLRMYNQE